jgi:hypothetical protein
MRGTASKWYNVRVYGAQGTYDGDPTYGDDAPGVQAAINAASQQGGTVYFPSGYYLLRTPLEIKGAISLTGYIGEVPHKGTGPLDRHEAFPRRRNNGTRYNGAWLLFQEPFGKPAILITGNGTVIRDLSFCHDQPLPTVTPWSPKPHDYVLDIVATDVLLSDLFFYNPTHAIRITLGQRIVLNRIFGQPLTKGIFIQRCVDTARFLDIAFWPYWSDHVAVKAWQKAHAVAIHSLWNDNPHFANLHLYAYKIGMHLGGKPEDGGTTRAFRVTDADMDECLIAMLIDRFAANFPVTGQVVNLTAGGFWDDNPDNLGISVVNENIRLQLTNIALSYLGGPGISVWATAATVVTIENIRVEFWNRAHTNKAAIMAVPGA